MSPILHASRARRDRLWLAVMDDHKREALDDEIRRLLDRYDEPVLLEMEAEAEARGFPAIGRTVGVAAEILARGIGARRVFELGSGFGYSAYWFARSVGDGGEVHLTEFDEANIVKAHDYLGRAGLEGRCVFHTGDALQEFAKVDGAFDIVFCDIDKHEYPAAFRAARERIRVGGLWICDNSLGIGAGTIVDELPGRAGEMIRGIREHDELVSADPDYLATILPIRDGVMVALRLR
jgi:predicted O-methyltransferase YrrM